MNYLYPVKEEYFESPPPSSSSSPTSQTRGDESVVVSLSRAMVAAI